MELAAGGCVSISDMYFNILDVARALDEAGMKANICHGLSSSDPGQRPESLKGWKDTLALLEQSKTGNGRIKVDVGLHAEYTSTEPLVRAAAGLARDHGLALHTHISVSYTHLDVYKRQTQYNPGCKGQFLQPGVKGSA